MKILVTGATGFIGNHVIQYLKGTEHEIIASGRTIEKVKLYSWHKDVEYIPCNYHNDNINFFKYFGEPDILIHLAWEGLPNYKSSFHVDKNLPVNCHFLKNFLEGGIKKIVITGTCYEYGLQCGCLKENHHTMPVTQYGLAKDVLRKYIEMLMPEYNTSFNWVRLFYIYGEGQSENSLIPQLKRAILANEKIFNMSGGEQLRDYLNIKKVSEYICRIALQNEINGIVNCCSGKPISIRRLVENCIAEMNSDIKLNLGYYPYPDYEPMAFWGDNTILKNISGIDDI